MIGVVFFVFQHETKGGNILEVMVLVVIEESSRLVVVVVIVVVIAVVEVPKTIVIVRVLVIPSHCNIPVLPGSLLRVLGTLRRVAMYTQNQVRAEELEDKIAK